MTAVKLETDRGKVTNSPRSVLVQMAKRKYKRNSNEVSIGLRFVIQNKMQKGKRDG